MGREYKQIGIEERCEIARLRTAGQSIREIAAALDRAPSTVARELKRNRTGKGEYKARYADEQAWARRWCGSRLERDDDLRGRVLRRLAQGWSPEQVAGRLAREAGTPVISYETIGSYTRRLRGRRTTDGDTTCRGASGDGAGGGAKAAVRRRSSRCGDRWWNARRRLVTGVLRDTGRRT